MTDRKELKLKLTSDQINALYRQSALLGMKPQALLERLIQDVITSVIDYDNGEGTKALMGSILQAYKDQTDQRPYSFIAYLIHYERLDEVTNKLNEIKELEADNLFTQADERQRELQDQVLGIIHNKLNEIYQAYCSEYSNHLDYQEAIASVKRYQSDLTSSSNGA